MVWIYAIINNYEGVITSLNRYLFFKDDFLYGFNSTDLHILIRPNKENSLMHDELYDYFVSEKISSVQFIYHTAPTMILCDYITNLKTEDDFLFRIKHDLKDYYESYSK